ncbi:MAG TPA: hypothetical protein VGO74_02505 [Modestobacter sp.]|nr:hypothetical protein [Modestobacter sp.]
MRALRLRAALLPLALAPVLLAGCSSDTESGTASPASSSAPAAESSSAEDEAQAADTAKKDTSRTEVPGLLSEITASLQHGTANC